MVTYMTRAVKTEVLAHEGARNGLVGLLSETHLEGKLLSGIQESVEGVEESSERDCLKSVKGAK